MPIYQYNIILPSNNFWNEKWLSGSEHNNEQKALTIPTLRYWEHLTIMTWGSTLLQERRKYHQKENKILSQEECAFSFQIFPTSSSRWHGVSSADLHLSFSPFHTMALPRQAKNELRNMATVLSLHISCIPHSPTKMPRSKPQCRDWVLQFNLSFLSQLSSFPNSSIFKCQNPSSHLCRKMKYSANISDEIKGDFQEGPGQVEPYLSQGSPKDE